MNSKRTITLTALSFVAICGMLYVTKSALTLSDQQTRDSTPHARVQSHPHSRLSSKPPTSLTTAQVIEKSNDLTTGQDTGEKEALITFNNAEDYQNFLYQWSQHDGLQLKGQSDRLFTARVGFNTFQQLENIEGAEISPNFPVTIPSPPEVSAQDGAVAFGNNALEAIGINQDNSDWGEGVTVAVIDSGVNAHLALEGRVEQLELTEITDESEQLGHGTAVASIISGNHPLTQGVAPAADILSIRVTDEFGSSDSFTLAQGILQAADAGAQIINISMGSSGNSSVVAEAVQYAQDRGAVIIASSGNEGLTQPAYPAAYDGVISVGAIEGRGEHVDFSNSGENLSLTAPGYQVNAAWGEDLLTSFSGTSASAPFVSGAIAAIISNNPGYTAQQATDLLLNYTNEAGPVGQDPQYGLGTLDIGRVMERDTTDVYDIAVTSQYLTQSANGDNVLTVIFQNQGTASLFNLPAQITTSSGVTQLSINSLSPGQTHSTTLYLPAIADGETLSIYSSADTSEIDIDPRNNRKENHFQSTSE